jgi:hypothetical protein
MRLSVAMAQAIRGSDLLVLPGGTHVGPLEQPDLLASRVGAFLAARVPVASRRRAPGAAPRAPRSRGRRARRSGA